MSGPKRTASPCWLLVGAALAAASPALAAPSADDIVKRSDDIMDPGESKSDLEMTVRRKGEAPRVYKMRLLQAASDAMLVLFEYPPRDKGQAFLRVGEDMWIYLPKVNKTMRISSKQAFAGGDFSNHDVLNVRLQQDYAAKLETDETMEGQPCHRLLLVGRTKNPPYASIRMWVRKDNLWPVKREFYTVGKRAFKTLIFRSKQSKARPDTLVMSNIMEKDKVTEMTWGNTEKVKHDPRTFTEAYLIRRR